MHWETWIPAITSTSVLAIVGFTLSVAYKAMIEKAVEAKFDHDLERFRGELRQGEERLRATMRQQEGEISTLRNGALTSMTARQSLLTQRRLDAAEHLWAAVISFDAARFLLQIFGTIDVSIALERSKSADEEGDRVRNFAGVMAKKLNYKTLPIIQPAPEVHRLYVTSQAWELFAAYQLTIAFALLQLEAMRTGTDFEMAKTPLQLLDIFKRTLPERSADIDALGFTAIYRHSDEFRAAVLTTLQSDIEGTGDDRKTVASTAEIMKLTEAMTKANTPASDVEIPKDLLLDNSPGNGPSSLPKPRRRRPYTPYQ